jgi:GT2 family glycosyltransferase
MESREITIAVVPRERFSYTRAALEALYQHTNQPFHLVYVDAGSPPRVRRYLESAARDRGFDLIRSDGLLVPNRARNLALAQVRTKYVVFIDNDVIVSPGWLPPLVECAEETNAAVVGPLLCESLPLHSTIHFAGGDSRIDIGQREGCVERHLVETILRQGQRVADVRHELRRVQTEVAEFHCMLVRTSVFDGLGQFDEAMLTLLDHIDFCLEVARAGGSIYFEPASIVTWAGYEPLALSDIPFFLLRWGNRWTRATLDHLCNKWQLTEDPQFQQHWTERVPAWRLRDVLVHGSLLRRVPSWKVQRVLAMGLVPFLSWMSDLVAARHASRPERVHRIQSWMAAPTTSRAATARPAGL